MQKKGNHSSGSFDTWGTGFYYQCDDVGRTLEIVQAKTGVPLICFRFDNAPSHSAEAFMRIFERAMQVTALMLSNYTTHQLVEVMEENRIKSILIETARVARHALDLEDEHFSCFEESFCKDYGVRKIGIRKVQGHESQSFLYFGGLETHQQNRIATEAETLSLLLSSLSDKVIHDLLAREIRYNNKAAPHQLMALSYKLTLLSQVVNRNFIPENYLKRPKSPPIQDAMSH